MNNILENFNWNTVNIFMRIKAKALIVSPWKHNQTCPVFERGTF